MHTSILFLSKNNTQSDLHLVGGARADSDVTVLLALLPPPNRAVSTLPSLKLRSPSHLTHPLINAFCSTIGILVSHFLISLQEAVNRRVQHLDDTHSSAVVSDSQDSAGTGSVSLVQFARADVDEWLDSESPGAPQGPVDDGPRAQWEEECIEALKTVQERVSSSDCHESV